MIKKNVIRLQVNAKSDTLVLFFKKIRLFIVENLGFFLNKLILIIGNQPSAC